MMESERGCLFAELFGTSPYADWRRVMCQPENWRPLGRYKKIQVNP